MLKPRISGALWCPVVPGMAWKPTSDLRRVSPPLEQNWGRRRSLDHPGTAWREIAGSLVWTKRWKHGGNMVETWWKHGGTGVMKTGQIYADLVRCSKSGSC